MKKKLKKSDNNVSHIINWAYIVDAFFCFILFLSIMMECICYNNVSTKYSISIDLIVVLLPTIIAIIAYSISQKSDSIFGVNLIDFRTLRKRFYYTFLHMVFFTSVAIAIYTMLNLMGFKITIITLDAICFLYSCIFAAQDIPVLIGDKNAIRDIIKSCLKHRTLYSKTENKTIDIIIRTMALEEGVEFTYGLLKSNCKKSDETNSILFDDIMESQNQYFFNAINDIQFLKANMNEKYGGIRIIKAIENGYDSIDKILFSSNVIDYDVTSSSSDKTYFLTRSTFALHKIIEELELFDKEKDMLGNIITNSLLYINNNQINKVQSYLCLMSICTLKEGELWFVKLLRDNNFYPGSLFSFGNNIIGFYLCLFIGHLFDKHCLSKDKEKLFISFINEETQGLNSDGSSWKSMITRMIEWINPKYAINSINQLLNLYRSINNHNYSFLKSKYYSDYSDEFTVETIFNSWLSLVLYGLSNEVDLDDFKKTIEDLQDDDKKILVNVLSRNWIKESKISQKGSFVIKGIIEQVNNGWYNKELIDYLITFHDDQKFEERKKEIDEDKVDLGNIESIFKDAINSHVSSYNKRIYIDQIDLNDEPELYFNVTIEKGDSNQIIDLYAKELPRSIDNNIQREIINKLTPIKMSSYSLSINEIENIKKFNPSIFSSKTDYEMIQGRDLNNINDSIANDGVLPKHLFAKDKGIQFKFELVNVIARYATEEEVNWIIDNKYQFDNGLYRYNRYSNDDSQSFLVTREHLKQLLCDSIIYVSIKFKKKVKVTKKKCLWYKYKI